MTDKVADLDRYASRLDGKDARRLRLSEERGTDRYILLGEPGIGKSTAFTREATAAGTQAVTASLFVRGTRPAGAILFIDALEEYRVGEAGAERLETLIDAIKAAGYTGWRIACRAISMGPGDAARVEDELGSFVTLQLEILDRFDQRAVLAAIGVSDPPGFMDRVAALGADALLGNPSTLKLLAQTIDQATTPITTRAALFAEATRQMSRELNKRLADRSRGPSPGQIEAAAEAACLVLMLSARSDLYLYDGLAPHDAVVERDDLLPGGVDTEALVRAVNTPMFKSDGVTFQATHRVVAEYLAGRALARAVVPDDPGKPALPIYRALGFCCGDNDRPAPALTGVFAWFVTMLAKSRRPSLAADLIPLDPEAVLFHGDAAALPPDQRLLLLDRVGRGDPWFLGAMYGSSAIGGLAGDDLAEPMRAILTDPGETRHRHAMVLEALANGRPVSALADTIRALVVTPSGNEDYRLRALDAYLAIVGDTTTTRTALLAALAKESPATSAAVRIALAARLVADGAIDADTLRAIIIDYSKTGDRTMGYAQKLSSALEDRPVPGLFDRPFDISREAGVARSFETRSLLDRALASAIAVAPAPDGATMLLWIVNAGGDEDRTADATRAAVHAWLDRDPSHERQLFEALEDAIARDVERFHRADFDFGQLSGRPISKPFRVKAVEAVEARHDSTPEAVVDRAIRLVQPYEDHADLYWRLTETLRDDPLRATQFTWLTVDDVMPWRINQAQRKRDAQRSTVVRLDKDRDWLRERIDAIARGAHPGAAVFAARIYEGHIHTEGDNGIARIRTWLGDDVALIAAIKSAMEFHVQSDPATVEGEAKTTASNRFPFADLVVGAWSDWLVCEGRTPTYSVPLAFRVLHRVLGQGQNSEKIKSLALDRLQQDEDFEANLTSYWQAAIRHKATYLPLAQTLDTDLPAVRKAAETILRGRQTLSPDILRDILSLAAPGMTAPALLAIAERMLKRAKPTPGHRLWAITAFLLAPDRYAALLDSTFSDEEGQRLLSRLWDGHFREISALANGTIVARSDALIRHLGPRFGPSDRLEDSINRPSELVGNAIATIAKQLTDDAVAALERLRTDPALAAWTDTITHQLTQQAKAIREARFRPPQPAAVAAALKAGPPASAADLRAVVRHTIEELARDIRTSNTASWRLFWNRPDKGVATPKVENDCRDLLTDRLRDRLERYGIPVRKVATEDRSMDDKRADLVVLGDAEAAVPVEAKRHWNSEIWTAVESQLVPYGRSVGSSGHGILLIFWFGIATHKVPAPARGTSAPASPDALRDALVAHIPEPLRPKIDVVVVDLSEPQTEP